MPSTYSPDLRIELIANGEKSGTWGTITNDNLGTIIEDAISGLASVSVLSANQALTAQNGAADEARCAAVSLTTTTTANFAVYVPPVTKLYVVKNASSYTATVYCSTVIGNTTAAGSGAAIPAGKTVLLRADGTNVFDQFNHVISSFSIGGNATVTGDAAIGGNLAVTGTATLGDDLILNGSSGTAGQVVISQGAGTYPVWGNAFVTGMIMMWSGTIATIPSGWLLCDGTSGTPDLRNKFVIAADADSGGAAKTTITGSATQTGGSKDAITVSHTHTLTDPGHRHNTTLDGVVSTGASFQSQIGRTTYNTADGGYEGYYSRGTSDSTQANASTSSTATTGISMASAGSSGTNANLVPYYALAFIMKS